MNNFWTLVGFEYKKIFIRKSTIIALIITVILTIFGCVNMLIGSGESFYSRDDMTNYEAMLYEKEQAIQFSGKPLDADFIMEYADQYKKLPQKYDTFEELSETEAYETYIQPYDIMSSFPLYVFSREQMYDLTYEEAENMYYLAEEKRNQTIKEDPLYSEEQVERIIERSENIETPYVLEYTEGYARLFVSTTTTMLMIIFLIIFIISPIFSNEYKEKMDHLILTTKNGKKSFLFAKIFSGVSISFLISLGLFLITIICMALTYGLDGLNEAIQLESPWIAYDFTMLESVVILCICIILGAILQSAICMILSSISKNPLIPMSVGFILILLASFSSPDAPKILATLRLFIPYSMGVFWDVLGAQLSWQVFGITIWLYQAVCIVALIVSSLLLLLTYRNFKQHQVG